MTNYKFTAESFFQICAFFVALMIFSTSLSADNSVDFEEKWRKAGEPVDFTLPDINGTNHSLSDFRGQWVVVNFWATWCAPCITEIPHLIAISNLTEPVKPVVIGIDFEEIDKETLQKFMDQMQMTYLNLIIGEAPLIPFEPLKGMPTTFLVSPAGHIAAKWVGAVTEEKVVGKLKELVSLSNQ